MENKPPQTAEQKAAAKRERIAARKARQEAKKEAQKAKKVEPVAPDHPPPADDQSPQPKDIIASLRDQIEASSSKNAIKLAKMVGDGLSDGQLIAELKEIAADLPKKRGKKSPMTESEISAALRTKRMDALNKKVDGSDFISGDPTDIIRRKFDIPDADTQMLEAVAHGLLDDFLQKIKVSTAAPRTDAQMDGQIEVDFGDGVETFNAIKPAKNPKHGIITDNRYIKKSSRGGVHFKPPHRRPPAPPPPVHACMQHTCTRTLSHDTIDTTTTGATTGTTPRTTHASM